MARLLAGIPPKIGHPLLAEVYPLPTPSWVGDWRAIYIGDFKFIWNSKKNHLLFNLKDDPGEEINLSGQQPQRVIQMTSELNQYIAQMPPPGPAASAQQLDDQTKKALESLGYVK